MWDAEANVRIHGEGSILYSRAEYRDSSAIGPRTTHEVRSARIWVWRELPRRVRLEAIAVDTRTGASELRYYSPFTR